MLETADPIPQEHMVMVRVCAGREVHGDDPDRTRYVAFHAATGGPAHLPLPKVYKTGDTLAVPTGEADHLQSTGYAELVAADSGSAA